MLEKWLEVQSLSIVFVGEFNPVIISPAWLTLKNLIREEEAINAKVDVIHNEIVQYDLDWVLVTLNKKRCEFRSSKVPYFDAVRDLAASIFKILKETPITSVGLNHIFELILPDEETYYRFGAKLTDLRLWENDLVDPRIMNLEILELNRKDGLPGNYRIRISPSGRGVKFGVDININDHIDLKSFSNDAPRTIFENWEKTFERSKRITNNFITNMKL